VARKRDPTGPTLPTIKRLFGHSGNQCAFPRCAETLFDGSTVVGKVCHIKGAKPGSARYDAQQSAAERHGFDNLILMCGRHHDVIDDDEEAYTVDRLFKMKAEHESRAASIADDFAQQAAQLLIKKPVVSVNQLGGITAHTVYVNPPAAQDKAADRHLALARIAEFHRERVKKLISPAPQIPMLHGGMLLMHVVPLQTFDAAQPDAFAKICASPQRFPPFVDTRPRDWKINFDGLFTGSNNDGLGKPQRAYVYVFRSGATEAVVSSLARGRGSNALQLPNIQCMIIHYGRVYAAALQAAGIQPPFAISVSLVGVKNMRLLQDFIGTAFAEDLPYGLLTENVLYFGEAVFDEVPKDDTHSAKMLRPILSHLANTAQLATSPYFDADGNYLLKPAQSAG
jgi:hypothetical protein